MLRNNNMSSKRNNVFLFPFLQMVLSRMHVSQGHSDHLGRFK